MSNPGSAENAVKLMMSGLGEGKYGAAYNIGAGGISKSGEVTTESLCGSCEVCFSTSTLKCGACKNVHYCCKEHQKQDWSKHKLQCAKRKSDLAKDKKHLKEVAKEVNGGSLGKPKSQPKAAWSAGFKKPTDKYIWLVNCYRMRVNDDRQWGGLARGLNSSAKASSLTLVMDLILFAKLAMKRDIIPTLDWSWADFLKVAVELLPFSFSKEDAIQLYGSENVFNAYSGGRSLRYTAEFVYLCPVNAQEPDQEREALITSLGSNIESASQLLDEIGGVDIWNSLLADLTAQRGC